MPTSLARQVERSNLTDGDGRVGFVQHSPLLANP